jgi:hypothetical protein
VSLPDASQVADVLHRHSIAGCWERKHSQTLPTYPELSSVLGGATVVPDYRGLFLRGHGSQAHVQENGTTVGVTSTMHSSGVLGAVQGDAIRDIIGDAPYTQTDLASPYTGALSNTLLYRNYYMHEEYNGGYMTETFSFRASRVVPTAPEIRPVNTAVRYLIRALP